MIKTEKDYWDQAKELLGDFEVVYDANRKFDFLKDPKGLLSYLSKCKFAMRMACRNRNVLELGSEIGIGASIMGELARSYLGVDADQKSVDLAKKNLPHPKYKFICDDFLGKKYGTFDSIVCFDAAIEPIQVNLFLQSIAEQLTSNGVLILGSSNPLLVQDKLQRHFFQVWDFGMSGEIIHTTMPAKDHLFLCCHKK